MKNCGAEKDKAGFQVVKKALLVDLCDVICGFAGIVADLDEQCFKAEEKSNG